MADRESRISFRPILRTDYPRLLTWMIDPDVARFYPAENPTLEGIEEEFGETIDGIEPVRGYMIAVDGTPVGYIQSYRLGDHPAYLAQLDLDPDDVSTDLFIGDGAFRNHGWGAPVLRAFLRQIVFGEMAAKRASIMPDHRNARAITVYQRVGFVPGRVVSVHDPDTGKIEDELIMILSREAFLADPGVS